MNRFIAVFCFSFFTISSVDVFAWGSLESQTVNGFSRYCTYTDGGVLTVSSTELCPINNSEHSKDNGSPTIDIQNRHAGFGSLGSQKVRGFNRYCSYTDGTVLTIDSTELCPITSK